MMEVDKHCFHVAFKQRHTSSRIVSEDVQAFSINHALLMALARHPEVSDWESISIRASLRKHVLTQL
jgi:hypothetical protein